MHLSMEPVRLVRETVSYIIVERLSNYLKVPKAASNLSNRLLDSVENIPINVNMYMDGLDTMTGYSHLHSSICFILFYLF